MEALLMVLGGLVGIGVGAAAGFAIGRALESRHTAYFWVTAVLFVAAGVGLAYAGLRNESDAVFVAGVGFIGGGLTGLKYGAHKVPGI